MKVHLIGKKFFNIAGTSLFKVMGNRVEWNFFLDEVFCILKKIIKDSIYIFLIIKFYNTNDSILQSFANSTKYFRFLIY